MNEIMAVSAVSIGDGAVVQRESNILPQRGAPPADFSSLLAQGVNAMDAKVAHADAMVSRFAIDDGLPVHQVTIALEEARLSVEFAMQVRQRLVEGYKELMNMQL